MKTERDKFYIACFKYGTSLMLFLIVGLILIVIQGEDPVEAVKVIWSGAFGSKVAFGNTLRWMAPNLMTAVAAIVAFKAGVMNLGIAGQVSLGGFVAGMIGAFVNLSPVLHITTCILAAGLCGVIVAFIPAMLKLFFNVNEFISTLMLNYVIDCTTGYFVQEILTNGKFELQFEFTNMEATPMIKDTAKLPILMQGTTCTVAILIALIIAIIVAILYKYTIQGYELKQVGENRRFAKIGGIKMVKTFSLIFLLSGLISGLCGGIEIVGTYKKFNVGFASNMGWDGISIARISELNPVALIFVSFIWSALKAGSLQMERVMEINRLTVTILQYLFVLFVSIDYEGIYMKVKNQRRIKNERKELSASVC